VLLAVAQVAFGAVPGLHEDVVFDSPSPHARTQVLLERLLSPLASRRALESMGASAAALPGYTVELAGERFAVYVPAAPPPPGGYGLFVFVAPWKTAVVPPPWRAALDEAGLLFVTAAAAGNDAPVLTRRAPLALDAVAGASARWPVDASRVYIGGFSGGARVALRLAMAWPDVFAGALVDGSADPVGSEDVPLPDRALLERAQDHLRLVYAWGTADRINVEASEASFASARDACIANVHRLPMRGRGHEPVDGATWRHALHLLESAPVADDGLAACRSRLYASRDADLANVRALQAAGRLDDVRKALDELDARYGALALPEIAVLDRKEARHE
jgi:dienelactone hydrolase